MGTIHLSDQIDPPNQTKLEESLQRLEVTAGWLRSGRPYGVHMRQECEKEHGEELQLLIDFVRLVASASDRVVAMSRECPILGEEDLRKIASNWIVPSRAQIRDMAVELVAIRAGSSPASSSASSSSDRDSTDVRLATDPSADPADAMDRSRSSDYIDSWNDAASAGARVDQVALDRIASLETEISGYCAENSALRAQLLDLRLRAEDATHDAVADARRDARGVIRAALAAEIGATDGSPLEDLLRRAGRDSRAVSRISWLISAP